MGSRTGPSPLLVGMMGLAVVLAILAAVSSVQ